ncbi:MAG: citrate/2-methylcitrate synthase [bacterium]|nr:citrate/2-methylcitrate synthase [bacterium]
MNSTHHEHAPDVVGVPLASLIAEASFVDVVFLLLRGSRPLERERAMLDAMLVAACDHGEEPPSTVAARVSASTGNALHTAIAAGILTMGPRHGCAVSAAMELLARAGDPVAVVHAAIAADERLPGFGHKVYTEEDPRTTALFIRASTLGIAGPPLERARALSEALATAKGRRIPLNVDGCLAALALALGFPSAAGNALFLVSRLPGLAAHALAGSTMTSYMRAPASSENR